MRVWEQGLVATCSMPGYKALIEAIAVPIRAHGRVVGCVNIVWIAREVESS